MTTFPKTKSPPEQPSAAQSVTGLIPNHPVLVVDDCILFLSDIVKSFHRIQCPVLTADSIEHAHQVLKRQACSGVCIDLQLGEQNGLNLLADLIQSTPHLPVLLCSQYRSFKGAVTALKLGARDFLHKPFEASAVLLSLFAENNQEELLESVRSCHQDTQMEVNVGDPLPLEAIENEHIRRVIEREKSLSQAAHTLRVHRTTLFRKKHLWDTVPD